MRRTLTALALAAGLALGAGLTALAQGTGPAPGGGGRIAVFDVARVVARSAAGVAAREHLEREKASMQREVDGKSQEIEQLREELEKKGALMTAEARREKEEALDRRRRDAVRLRDDLQREFVRRAQQMEQKLLVELRGVVENLGRQRGYYLILERQGAGVVFASAEADLTDEIIRVYDQESAARGKK